jgi:predicted phage terminase large subunit-like protein
MISNIGWNMIRPLATQVFAEVHESTRTLTFPTGGSISCKSGDKPDNLRGESLAFVIMDEADFMPERVWTEVIRPALSDQKGGALIISTPNIEGGWFHSLFNDGQDDQIKDVKSWRFPSVTNPFLDPDEIESAKKSLPDIVFRREFLAEFVSSSGALLREDWLKETHDIPPRNELTITMGVDLAISTKEGADFTAAVVIGHHRSGKIYILDAQRTRTSFDGVLKFINEMAQEWQPESVSVEQVQFQAAVVSELLRTTNLPVRGVRPDKDKITRFYPVQARFEQGLIYLANTLPREFKKELLGFPVGQFDDFVDALAYAYRAISAGSIGMS